MCFCTNVLIEIVKWIVRLRVPITMSRTQNIGLVQVVQLVLDKYSNLYNSPFQYL